MSIARVGDINIEYYVEGDGPPLLMIHGFSSSANDWGEPFLKELRPHFRVVRFSNRGTGLSDKPDAEYSIRMMADEAAGLLKELDVPNAHVFGISMGAAIAQELALNHRELVRGLVLGCSTCGGTHRVPAQPEAIALLALTPELTREDQIRRSWPAFLTPGFIDREPDFLEEMLRTSLEHPTPLHATSRQLVAAMQHSSYERLPNIQSPTLIVHGDKDRVSPVQNGHILHDRIPNSTLQILPDVGHGFFWEKPKESGEAIVKFLSSVPAPA